MQEASVPSQDLFYQWFIQNQGKRSLISLPLCGNHASIPKHLNKETCLTEFQPRCCIHKYLNVNICYRLWELLNKQSSDFLVYCIFLCCLNLLVCVCAVMWYWFELLPVLDDTLVEEGLNQSVFPGSTNINYDLTSRWTWSSMHSLNLKDLWNTCKRNVYCWC